MTMHRSLNSATRSFLRKTVWNFLYRVEQILNLACFYRQRSQKALKQGQIKDLFGRRFKSPLIFVKCENKSEK